MKNSSRGHARLGTQATLPSFSTFLNFQKLCKLKVFTYISKEPLEQISKVVNCIRFSANFKWQDGKNLSQSNIFYYAPLFPKVCWKNFTKSTKNFHGKKATQKLEKAWRKEKTFPFPLNAQNYFPYFFSVFFFPFLWCNCLNSFF